MKETQQRQFCILCCHAVLCVCRFYIFVQCYENWDLKTVSGPLKSSISYSNSSNAYSNCSNTDSRRMAAIGWSQWAHLVLVSCRVWFDTDQCCRMQLQQYLD
jgi:hypothetical protein